MPAKNKANTNDNRRFPLWPRVPQDQDLAGQTVGGTPQRWAYFEEYKPFIGVDPPGPFEGLWSVEGGDLYSGVFSFSGALP